MYFNRLKLDESQKNKWYKNTLIFFIPIITTYLGSLGFIFSQPNHILKASDFIPNLIVLGGIIYYIQSVLLDYYKKLKG